MTDKKEKKYKVTEKTKYNLIKPEKSAGEILKQSRRGASHFYTRLLENFLKMKTEIVEVDVPGARTSSIYSALFYKTKREKWPVKVIRRGEKVFLIKISFFKASDLAEKEVKK
jgi:hypothetical protein